MYIADLHIHSRYSRATSRDGIPEYLELWARRKGIGLLGTGDFTHPAWRKELKEKLLPAEEGLYILNPVFRAAGDFLLGPEDDGENRPRFVVTGEISSIYKKNGKVRKVHNVIVLPSLEAADALARKLEAIGNIHSDGRPILGLDCRDLLEITLETCAQAIFIPAHIWTPHFSLFGAFSGFDTIEECFEDLTSHIHALETGLSSDPPMNWRLSALDRYHLVSTSDAHSPNKLGREATLIEGELSFPGLKQAMESGPEGGLAGTIEFFPEEGKYHLDGHRSCGLCLEPAETIRYNGRCPVCGKKLTIGVLHRVEQLADRPEGYQRAGAPAFESLAPLPEVIAASTGMSAASTKVTAQYLELLRRLGPEFRILRQTTLEAVAQAAGPCIAEGLRRLRAGEVRRIPGYDGEYGIIRLLEPEEIDHFKGQGSLFAAEILAAAKAVREKTAQRKKAAALKAAAYQEITAASTPDKGADPFVKGSGETSADASLPPSLLDLNSQQRQAVTDPASCLAIVAGPGTGKTKTLVARIRYLLEERGIRPQDITAVTFTNKAAAEMRQRLEDQLGSKRTRGLTIGTFHALCLQILEKQYGSVKLLSETEARDLAAPVLQELGLKLSPSAFLEKLSRQKNQDNRSRFPQGREGSYISAAQEGERISFVKTSFNAEASCLPPEASVTSSQRKTIPQSPASALAAKDFLPEGSSSEEEAAFIQAASHYQAALERLGYRDFDDLLLDVLELYENKPGGAAAEQLSTTAAREGADWDKGQKSKALPSFPCLLIDEYQDINPLQHRLIHAFSRSSLSLFVIGDPDQSIYGFRGADAHCFDRLKEEQPRLQLLHLTKNYRSAPEILSCALPVINKNPGSSRLLEPCSSHSGLVRFGETDSDLSEAIFIAKEINRLVGGVDMLDAQNFGPAQDRRPRDFQDIAVLCRTHRQLELIEKCLRKESIPYIVAGRESFLEDPNVRGVVSFFQSLQAPDDLIALRFCLKELFHCTEKTLETASAGKLQDASLEASASVLSDEGLANWHRLAEKYRPRLSKEKPRRLFEEFYKDLGREDSEALQRLLNMSVFHSHLSDFLQTLLLGTEQDLLRASTKAYTAGAVRLLTFHGAKGLEFPVVFLAGLKQGLLPLELPGRKSDSEEERRLFYVGLTRAREELILLSSAAEPSPFLADLPRQLLQKVSVPKGTQASGGKQLSLFS